MLAPCISPTKASDRAGIIRPGMTASDGSTGRGSEPGISAISLTNATASAPNSGTTSEATIIATTNPKAFKLVFSSVRIRIMVRMPTNNVGRWTCSRCRKRSIVRTTLFAPTLLYPVKSSNCPKMMRTATPLMNPVMTAFGTKRTSEPSLSRPAASMNNPVRIDSVNRGRLGSLPCVTWGTLATTRAMALVACTDINAELVKKAPLNVPNI